MAVGHHRWAEVLAQGGRGGGGGAAGGDDEGGGEGERGGGDEGGEGGVECKKKGGCEKCAYGELQMTDENGKHWIAAMLNPNPIHLGQAEDVTTVAVSADASQLPRCRFLVVCYGSNEGDVGYTLDVRDFLDIKDPITER